MQSEKLRPVQRWLPTVGEDYACGATQVRKLVIVGLAACLIAAGLATAAVAQTISVVGTRHLTGLEQPPGKEQFSPALDEVPESVHEVYSLGVPLARMAGLHELSAAVSLEDESRGIRTAIDLGLMPIMHSSSVQARFDELHNMWDAPWQSDSGPGALTRMLHYFNSGEFAESDRRLQWEPLREFDNEGGNFRRRSMYWHWLSGD